MVEMTQEEINFLEQQEREKLSAQAKFEQDQMIISQNSMSMTDNQKGLFKEQLDLTDELKRMSHLLKSEVEEVTDKGEKIWVRPSNNDEILLSDEGVRLIMRTLNWYLSKNTLLSNYSEEVINHKMEDLATTLNDYMFMNYEKYFLFPTNEECQKLLIERLKRRQQSILHNAELRQEKVDKDKVWNMLVNEIKDLERERIKIREQIMKDKLKGFEWLIRCVQDSIHSAYLRALNGQERKTLRQHHHTSEMVGERPHHPKQSGGPMSWFKSR
ncbi:hypothetical protein CMI47_14110 [Candidatus Pacearchaeota archaeon]|jgi:hypothetical protein|nr:hypothetical protein [Candidatus Pacearchaeota archaeon]|tara:strand:- start:6592 stop:7404 length:813 start_codon:yes stop_codon:yes gene_type:complete